MRSTVQDLLTFLPANIDLAESRLYMAMQITHEPLFPVGSTMQVGIAWHMSQEGKIQMIWHHGATGGYWAFTGFSNDTQTGIMVPINSFQDIDEIGHYLLRVSVE